MSSRKGTIALMGSGELTATMVEVHKELLAALPHPPRAVFVDTPAGFQLNVDQLSRRAVEYFLNHVQLYIYTTIIEFHLKNFDMDVRCPC